MKQNNVKKFQMTENIENEQQISQHDRNSVAENTMHNRD